MEFILTLFSNTVFLLLCLLETAVWARVILGYFLSVNDSVLYKVFYFVTEPFLLPVRALLGKARISGGLFDPSAAVFASVVIVILAVLPKVTV